ncbi:MAG: hypothetical protein FJW20_13690 [Acidimicrobiia bacterium]|nr:hypothetical protein [Acidimicrobiia bacterium]
MFSLADVMRGTHTNGAAGGGSGQAARPSQAVDPAYGFGDQLSQAISNSLASLGIPTGQLKVDVKEAAGQNPGAGSMMRQFVVTVSPSTPSLDSGQSSALANIPPGLFVGESGKLRPHRASDFAPDTIDRLPAIPSNNLSVNDLENPVPELVSILQGMGVDTSRMTFELYDDIVDNLGGRYTNHYIRTDLGNGIQQDYSVEWTLRNPKVTAVDIASLLKLKQT